MLDSLFRGSSTKARQNEELATLVSQAKDERAAISAVLTQVSAGSAKLAQTGKALDQVSQKSDAALKRLDGIGQKVAGFDERLKAVQGVNEELGRATTIKEELLSELAHVQTRQRDAVTQTDRSSVCSWQ